MSRILRVGYRMSSSYNLRRNRRNTGVLRHYQIAPKKLYDIWMLYESIFSNNSELAIEYFGKPPYEFLDKELIRAQNFGKYGFGVDQALRAIADLNPAVASILDENDIGTYIDSHARQYLPGYDINKGDYFVRLPKGKTTEQSPIPFPNEGETITIYRRGIEKTFRVTDIIQVRKATAWIQTIVQRVRISNDKKSRNQ